MHRHEDNMHVLTYADPGARLAERQLEPTFGSGTVLCPAGMSNRRIDVPSCKAAAL